MRDPDFQVLKFEIDALQEFISENPYLNDSIFAEEKILDMCILRVNEGILMHVCSQYGHIYSILITP